MDSEQNFQIRYWRMFIDYETHQLQSNYVAYICFNAEIGLFILLSISQHNTVWWSDRSIHRPFHQSTQYHVVVRSVYSSSFPSVNTIPFGGQIGLFVVLSISQHNTMWWSDRSIHRPFHQSTQYHVVVRSKACETVTMGGGVHDLSAEFSIVSFHLALVDTSTFWSSGQTCF